VDNGDIRVNNIANFSILSNQDKSNYARGDIIWYSFLCGIKLFDYARMCDFLCFVHILLGFRSIVNLLVKSYTFYTDYVLNV